jgi:hypothetical protein
MLANLVHRAEIALSRRDTNRRVRPFDWGLEFLDTEARPGESEQDTVMRHVEQVLARSRDYYQPPPLTEHHFDGSRLTFPSALQTPWECNNSVLARYFPARSDSRRAVIILPQWNADGESHVALAKILARFGVSALRLSLPYHDVRMPTELQRADYMVSSNVGRTLQACRQAILDVRQCVDWLLAQGHESVGIMGTSIGSCIGFLTFVHERRLRAGVFNHVSSYFADVVWTGISTRHVRKGFDGAIDLETLRRAWLPISPNSFIHLLKDEHPARRCLMITARYDLTFLPYLADWAFDEFHRHNIAFDKAVLRCGHYTSGKFPFNCQLGYLITNYLVRNLAEG